MSEVHRRNEAENALGKAQGFFYSLVQNVSDVIGVLDADGTVSYVGPAVEGMLGYAPEQVVGTSVFDYVHPEDLERAFGALAETLATPGDLAPIELRALREDGSWRHVEVVSNNRLDDPDVAGVVINVRDVTERKGAEETLEENEAFVRGLLRNLPNGSVNVFDGELRYLLAEGRGLEEVGLSSEMLVGRTIGEVFGEEGLGLVEGHYRRAFSGEEVRFELPVGGNVYEINAAPLRVEEDGGVLTIIAVAQDITERKEAEEQRLRLAEHLRLLLESTDEGIFGLDLEGRCTFVNRAAARILGYESQDLIGQNMHELVHHSHVDGSPYPVEECPMHRAFLEGQGARVGDEVMWRRDGTPFPAEYSSYPVTDGRGGLEGATVTFFDITERKRAEDRLREAEERYRTLVERIPAVTFIDRIEGSSIPVYVSPQVERMLGYTPEEWMEGRLWRERLHSDDRERILASDERFEATGGAVDQEYRLFAKDGSVVWVREETVLVRGEGGEPLFVQGILTNVTERKRMEERLQHQAFQDPLTGLPNRHLFVDRLGQAIRRTKRIEYYRVAALFLDLDNFKSVNDSLGHETGDLLLVAVAERIKGCMRPEDTLARFGGDEFVVLLEGLEGPSGAVRVAQRIADELRQPFSIGGRELFAAASIGIALGEDRTTSPEDLLRDADTAMYRAKEKAADYRVFDRGMYLRAVARLELENELRRAVERNEFVLHYQPIVQLEDGRLRSVEALVRWAHPDRGFLDPDEFVPLAEESGLVIPMGEQVLREACLKAKEWQEEFPRMPPLAMSVNLSAKQLSRPDLPEIVEGVLKESGLDGACLTLDITETASVGVLDGDTGTLDRLRTMGVGISIDDFGTGYSSLSYLKMLPADALKIDKSFVKGLGEDVEDTAVVGMVIELAHTFGMEAIAEGVEAEEQAALLEELGCDLGQGFYFAEPLPPEAMSEYLAR